jgi:multiple sugar transport system substrate-binding protein
MSTSSSGRRPSGAFGVLSSQASRRQLLGWGGAGIVGLTLAACSSGGRSSSFAPPSELTFTHWDTGAPGQAIQQAVLKYAKSKKLKGNTQFIPQVNYLTKMNTLIAGNNFPDAGYLSEGSAMRLGSEGLLVNVADQDGFKDFISSAIHYYAPGKAVTQTCVEALTMFYNEKAFATAGLKAPVTVETAWKWDDFISAADKLTLDKNGKHPSDSGYDASNVKQYGVIAPYVITALVALFRSNGTDLFAADGKSCNFDSAAGIEVMQQLNDLIFVHRVAPNAAQTTELGATSAVQLPSGKVAMAVDGQWNIPDLNAAKQSQGLQYNTAVLPTFGQGVYTINLSGATVVFAKSNNKEAAMGLVLDLADPSKVPLYSNGLWMPPQQKFYSDSTLRDSWMKNDAHPSNYATSVADMVMDHSFAFPSYKLKNFDQISSSIASSLTPLFTQKTDMKTACKTLATQVNSLMQGTYPDTKS